MSNNTNLVPYGDITSLCFIAGGYPKDDDHQFIFLAEIIRTIADRGIYCTVIAPHSLTNVLFRKSNFRPFHWIDTTLQGNSIDVYQPKCLSISNFKLLGKSVSAILSKRATIRTFKKINRKVDVLYAHFWTSGFVAGEIANKYNLPFFVATGESEIRVTNQFSSAYIQERMKQLKGVISVSTKNKNESRNLGLGVDIPYIILPNAINPSKFKPFDRLVVREVLNCPKDAFIISFIGAFIERKGPLRVLEAVRKLEDPFIKIIFIGDGPQKPEGDEVLFAGRVPHDDVAQYLSASDVFVLPTLAEGCSNAIVEAMACGLPIISSDLEFNHDILDSDNALLISPMDLTEISEAIKSLKGNRNILESMGKNSKTRVAKFSLLRRSDEILKFIARNQSL